MSGGPGLESLVDRKQISDKPFLLLLCFMYIYNNLRGVLPNFSQGMSLGVLRCKLFILVTWCTFAFEVYA